MFGGSDAFYQRHRRPLLDVMPLREDKYCCFRSVKSSFSPSSSFSLIAGLFISCIHLWLFSLSLSTMHLLSLVPAFMAAGALAAPRPQMPDYAAVDALLPELTKTIDVTAKPTIIDFDVTGAIEDVAAAVETGIVAISKRAARTPDNSGCGVCKNEPTIANSYNVDVSTDTAFLGDANIIAAANGATTPTGYTSVFTNKKASLNGYVYMGYTVLKSTPAYDPSVCATKCDAMAGCQSFNICKTLDERLMRPH